MALRATRNQPLDRGTVPYPSFRPRVPGPIYPYNPVSPHLSILTTPCLRTISILISILPTPCLQTLSILPTPCLLTLYDPVSPLRTYPSFRRRVQRPPRRWHLGAPRRLHYSSGGAAPVWRLCQRGSAAAISARVTRCVCADRHLIYLAPCRPDRPGRPWSPLGNTIPAAPCSGFYTV